MSGTESSKAIYRGGNNNAKGLIYWQSDENIIKLNNEYQNNPIVSGKESIKRAVKII